jgi:hypothetical protein
MRCPETLITSSIRPVVAVRVAPRAVAGEIGSGEVAEIGGEEALVVAIDGAHLARPAVGDHQRALARSLETLALAIDDRELDPEHRLGRAAGLERGGAGEGGDHVPAGLGLPPGVDDRAAPLADFLVVPLPRLGIDRLADSAEHFQALAAGL